MKGASPSAVTRRVAKRFFCHLLFLEATERVYHLRTTEGVHVGAASLCFSRVRFLTLLRLVPFSYAQSSAAPLRARRPSFRHLQLLSAPAVSRNPPRSAPFCEDPGPGPLAIPIPADRLCSDARARASAGQRTEEGQSLEDVAGAQTESFPRLAQAGEKAAGAVIAGIRSRHG